MMKGLTMAPTPLAILPVHAHSTNYTEWETVHKGTCYCIVQDAGDWALLRRDAGQWEPVEISVEEFLETHNLQLAEP